MACVYSHHTTQLFTPPQASSVPPKWVGPPPSTSSTAAKSKQTFVKSHSAFTVFQRPSSLRAIGRWQFDRPLTGSMSQARKDAHPLGGDWAKGTRRSRHDRSCVARLPSECNDDAPHVARVLLCACTDIELSADGRRLTNALLERTRVQVVCARLNVCDRTILQRAPSSVPTMHRPFECHTSNCFLPMVYPCCLPSPS